jgi:hypothetical protein
MSVEFRDRVFEGWDEFDSGRTHAGMTFTDCEFRSCILALDKQDLSLTARVTDMVFRRCAVTACDVTAAIVEDVLVDGLRTSGLFQTWATVFKHVTLKGKIDRLMLSDVFSPNYPTSQFQQVVAKAHADYYAAVDWALDISEAEFKELDCRGVPSRLVRRDPETQIMVTRERVLASGDAVTAGGDFWQGMLNLFLQMESYSDAVFVAPKRSRRFKELQTGLRLLREAGVAEPD